MSKDIYSRLFDELRHGNTTMLETIYTENRIAFLNFARKFGVLETDAVDIYQDVIIAFRDNIVNGKLQKLDSTIRTYLFSIGKFMIYKFFNRRNHEISINEKDIKDLKEEFDFSYYDKIDDNKYQKLVKTGFNELTETCYEVLLLYYYNGLTLEEIQTYLGYDNYNVVKSQKSRCLRSLKEIIKKLSENG